MVAVQTVNSSHIMRSVQEEQPEIYVFSKRTESESKRLNYQHELAKKVCDGSLTHPMIQTKTITNVADIACGTGIWIEDFRAQMKAVRPRRTAAARFDAFDISSAQFPSPSETSVNYHVHDMLVPFPVEFHELYDLVHVRYLCVAFKKEQFLQAATNLLQLLRPGGYIQWEETDYQSLLSLPPSPTHSFMHAFTSRMVLSSGMTLAASYAVEEALLAIGLTAVRREERNSYYDKEMKVLTPQWMVPSFRTLMGRALIWSGEVEGEEEAKIVAERYVGVLEGEYNGGCVPNFPHRVMVGRRPYFCEG